VWNRRGKSWKKERPRIRELRMLRKSSYYEGRHGLPSSKGGTTGGEGRDEEALHILEIMPKGKRELRHSESGNIGEKSVI